MKKVLSLILSVFLILGLVGCGVESNETPAAPANEQVRVDLQDYINEMLDASAEISIFERTSEQKMDNSLVITCNVLYEGDTKEDRGEFVLTYDLLGNEWILSKCRMNHDEDEKQDETLNELENEPESEVENESENEPTTTDDALESSEEDSNTDNVSATMSDELYDFTFILDGVTYQLPFAYSQLAENGWDIYWGADSDESTIPANSYDTLQMSKNGVKINIDVVNLSGDTQKIKDLVVGGIKVTLNDLVDADLFTIAKNIGVSATVDEVTAAFGTANKTYNGDEHTALTYRVDNYVEVEFYVYKEKEQSNTIRLRNFIGGETNANETSADVPEYLSAYQPPTELGQNLFDGIIELDGDLYKLPAPVQTFLDNGWIITYKTNEVGSGNKELLEFERDGKKLSVYIYNFAEYQTIPENCAVYDIKVWGDYNLPTSAPMGITFTTTKEQLESMLPKTFSFSDDSSKYYLYSYNDYMNNYDFSIQVDKETDLVCLISLSHRNWVYE